MNLKITSDPTNHTGTTTCWTSAMQAGVVLIFGWLLLLPAFVGSQMPPVLQEYGSTLQATLIMALQGAACLVFSFAKGMLIVRILATIGGIVVLYTVVRVLFTML